MVRARSGPRHFSANSRVKKGVSRSRFFPREFSRKIALVTSPRAIRLRRLAQNDCPGPGAWGTDGIFPKLLLWDVHVPCAFGLRRLAQSVGRGVVPVLAHGTFPVNSRVTLLLWDVHVHFGCAGSHKTVVPVLACGHRSRTENLAGVLVRSSPKRSLHGDLADPMS